MTPIEVVLNNGDKYQIVLRRDIISLYVDIIDVEGYAYERRTIDDQINWSMELDHGRIQTPIEVRHVADKLLANKAFL